MASGLGSTRQLLPYGKGGGLFIQSLRAFRQARTREIGNGKGEMGDGRWEMGKEKSEVGSGKWKVDSGRCEIADGNDS